MASLKELFQMTDAILPYLEHPPTLDRAEQHSYLVASLEFAYTAVELVEAQLERSLRAAQDDLEGAETEKDILEMESRLVAEQRKMDGMKASCRLRTKQVLEKKHAERRQDATDFRFIAVLSLVERLPLRILFVSLTLCTKFSDLLGLFSAALFGLIFSSKGKAIYIDQVPCVLIKERSPEKRSPNQLHIQKAPRINPAMTPTPAPRISVRAPARLRAALGMELLLAEADAEVAAAVVEGPVTVTCTMGVGLVAAVTTPVTEVEAVKGNALAVAVAEETLVETAPAAVLPDTTRETEAIPVPAQSSLNSMGVIDQHSQI
ncbi:hypothetical protein H0H92_009546 [Tricholoma furcatifolium]|nr:hypothetical protein H0H92_009546 [Tricholoma furcatifolium]